VSEENIGNQNVEAGRKKRRHPVLRGLLFALLGLLAVLLVTVQVLLNSSVLSRIVSSVASEQVDGSVTFLKINASVFRSFPNLNVTIKDFSLTYPHEMFAAYDSLTPIGDVLQNMGRGEEVDTLAHFDKLSVAVNYLSLLKGRYNVRNASLEHPRIFAHKYDSTTANWNILKFLSAEKDTTSSELPPFLVSKVSLTGRPVVVFSDPSDTLFASMFMKELDFKGRLTNIEKKENRVSFRMDSLLVAGRLPADTVALAVDYLKISEHGDRFLLDLNSTAHLAMRSIGRLDVPIALKGTVSPDLAGKVVEVEKLKAEVATIEVNAEGKVDYSGKDIYLKAAASIDEEPVSDVTRYLSDNFPALKKLSTDALLSADFSCDGYYVTETGSLPPLTFNVRVPDSKVGWKGLEKEGRLGLQANATSVDGKLVTEIPEFNFTIDGAKVDLKASSEDLFAEDPSLTIDSDIHAMLDSLVRFLPSDMDVTAHGNLDGNLSGDVRLSQLSLYNFSNLGLKGSLVSNGIFIDYPKDTLTAYLGRTSIDVESGLTMKVDSLYSEYGASTFIRGTGISLSARNSEETMLGEADRHPIQGQLDISSVGMMDVDSCFIALSGSSNTFKLTQMKNKRNIVPYLSLNSRNKGIAVREGVNRYSISDAVISLAAHPDSLEKKARRKQLLDSLQKVYPTVPRDSLLYRSYSRGRRSIPDYLSEKDFEKSDITIHLSKSIANYFRNWDLSGSLKIADGAVITPYYPLENRLSDLRGRFTNDRITLSNVTLNSGVSDVSASGTLTGIQRLVTSGRSRLNLDMDINSGLIDVNEILLALNAGKNFENPGENLALMGVDDKTYLDAVQVTAVVDTSVESSLLVIPSNLNAKVRVNANTVKYSDLETSFLTSEIEMRERCLNLTNTLTMTNMGTAYVEGFYSTRTKKDLKAGFDLTLTDITAEKVIHLFPAVDSIIPMLKAFKGMLDCEMAATASIDEQMKIVMPTLNGIMKIDGKGLTLDDSESLNKLRKTLMFRDRDSSYIEKMSVRGIIKENVLELFPFLLNVDRYSVSVNGLQNFDTNFKYHISAFKSPIPFRFGVNLNGNFSDWKWKLARAKYKSANLPSFDDQVDNLRFNLISAIHNIYERGVDNAMKQTEESQTVIEERKVELEYSTAEIQADSLSSSEQKRLQVLEKLSGMLGHSESSEVIE